MGRINYGFRITNYVGEGNFKRGVSERSGDPDRSLADRREGIRNSGAQRIGGKARVDKLYADTRHESSVDAMDPFFDPLKSSLVNR